MHSLLHHTTLQVTHSHFASGGTLSLLCTLGLHGQALIPYKMLDNSLDSGAWRLQLRCSMRRHDSPLPLSALHDFALHVQLKVP